MLKKNKNTKLSKKGENSQGEKTKEQDFQYFKKLVKQHINYFKSKDLVKSIFEYAQESYLAYFHLYKLFFQYKKVERTIQLPVFIDEPIITESLDNAVYLGVQKNTPEQEEARMKQEIEAKVQKEDEEKKAEQAKEQEKLKQLQKEEQERLDPKALEIIQEKIKEAEISIKNKLEERQKGLNEKLQQLENPKKK